MKKSNGRPLFESSDDCFLEDTKRSLENEILYIQEDMVREFKRKVLHTYETFAKLGSRMSGKK